MLANIDEWQCRKVIDCVPDCYDHSSVEYSSDCSEELKNINGRTTESIKDGWAIFQADSGKMICEGGRVYSGSMYYLIHLKNAIPQIFKSDALGIIPNSEYSIHRFQIPYEPETNLIQLLASHGITIESETKATIILWPPCINQYDTYKTTMPRQDMILWSDDIQRTKLLAFGSLYDLEEMDSTVVIPPEHQHNSTIEISHARYREYIEIKNFDEKDRSEPIQPKIILYDKSNNPVDKFNKQVSKISTNFKCNIDLFSHNRFIRNWVSKHSSNLELTDPITKIIVYSDYRYICSDEYTQPSIPAVNITVKDLMDHPRVTLPSNFDQLLLKISIQNPVLARLIKRYSSNGTIAKKILKYLVSA